jgi:hypothetical protein
LGYKKQITYADYMSRYTRQDIAKAVIDRPVKQTWSGPLIIQESNDDQETPFEAAWKVLEESHQLKTKFSRVDKLAGIGSYAILLLGLDDVKSQQDFSKPVPTGTRKLIYVKPYGEGAASIVSYVKETTDPRYGLPEMYQIKVINAAGSTGANTSSIESITVNVHYSRIIHIVYEVLENETIGIPSMEVIYNRLQDLEKIVGGDAEMFWRGARPGYAGKVDEKFQSTSQTQLDLKNQIDEYENNLRRILVTEGVDLKALDSQVTDPTNHVAIQIGMISAEKQIPKRILLGSERGELSSSQDADEWRTYCQNRRDEHAGPHIVKPFVKKMIELNILPKPGTEEWSIIWSDLFALSEADLIKIGKDRTTALKDYSTNPVAEAIIPPEAFLQYFLGFNDDQIAVIQQLILAGSNDSSNKDKISPEEQAILDEEAIIAAGE